MSESPMPEAKPELEELERRVARALLLVDLDALTPAARDEGRRLLHADAKEFDGDALVTACLRNAGPASVSTVQRGMLALRSRFLGIDGMVAAPSGGRRSKKRSGFKRFLAWLVVKAMFLPILIVLTVVILVLLKRSNPELDVYVWGNKAMDFLGLR